MAHVVLALTVRQKKPCHYLNSAIYTLHLHPLPLPKLRPCPRHQPLIRLHRHPYRHVTFLTNHTHRLPRIFPEADPVKEACKYAECPLQPLQLGRGNEFIFGINYAARSLIDRPSTSVPSHVATTTVTKWRTTESMTTLKSVDDRGYPWVTPRYLLKGGPYYPLALVTMVSRRQYVRRIRSDLGPTPYTARISSHFCRSRASYAFWRSRNTS